MTGWFITDLRGLWRDRRYDWEYGCWFCQLGTNFIGMGYGKHCPAWLSKLIALLNAWRDVARRIWVELSMGADYYWHYRRDLGIKAHWEMFTSDLHFALWNRYDD